MPKKKKNKNKGGILNKDKARIGYQEGKDVDVEKPIDLGGYSDEEQKTE